MHCHSSIFSCLCVSQPHRCSILWFAIVLSWPPFCRWKQNYRDFRAIARLRRHTFEKTRVPITLSLSINICFNDFSHKGLHVFTCCSRVGRERLFCKPWWAIRGGLGWVLWSRPSEERPVSGVLWAFPEILWRVYHSSVGKVPLIVRYSDWCHSIMESPS